MNRILLTGFVAVASVGIGPRCAQAGPVPLIGDVANRQEMLGNFVGSIDYSYTSSTTGTLSLVLTNQSTISNGGFLVAFAFNNPSDMVTSVTLTTTPPGSPASNFTNVLGGPSFQNGISASPYASFDIGASVTNDWLGGGSPTGGLGVGQTGAFTFSLIGTALDTLTSQSFIDTLNEPGGYSFAARFRGFQDGGSDKVPGLFGPTQNHPNPEPASIALFGIGAIGLIGVYRRKTQRAVS